MRMFTIFIEIWKYSEVKRLATHTELCQGNSVIFSPEVSQKYNHNKIRAMFYLWECIIYETEEQQNFCWVIFASKSWVGDVLHGRKQYKHLSKKNEKERQSMGIRFMQIGLIWINIKTTHLKSRRLSRQWNNIALWAWW